VQEDAEAGAHKPRLQPAHSGILIFVEIAVENNLAIYFIEKSKKFKP
jgi:hypothetical protein